MVMSGYPPTRQHIQLQSAVVAVRRAHLQLLSWARVVQNEQLHRFSPIGVDVGQVDGGGPVLQLSRPRCPASKELYESNA